MQSNQPAVKRSNDPMVVTALQIVREAVQADVQLSQLTKRAHGDPGFALRVISVANSPAMGFRRKVADLQHASQLLGVRGLRNIALGLAVGGMVPPSEAGKLLMAQSLRRASAARLIAERLEASIPDEYFTAGLLLEIGLLARAREEPENTLDVARTPAVHRVLYEHASGQTDHAVGGAQVVREMGLSGELELAVLHHHDAEPPADRLQRVCWVAEQIAGLWEGGDLEANRVRVEQGLRGIGLGPSATESILRAIPEAMREGSALFEQDVGAQPDIDELVRDAHQQVVLLNQSYAGIVRRLESLLAEKERLARELSTLNEHLAAVAATDALTELPNKRSLQDSLMRDLARADRSKAHLAIVFLDIDHFKAVNDQYGHLVGDEVLQQVARILRAQLRVGDVCGRWGGEEFLMLLPDSDARGGGVVAERIRVSLAAQYLQTAAGPVKVSASFGVAEVKGPGCQGMGASLVDAADRALYAAKKAGRNRVVISYQGVP